MSSIPPLPPPHGPQGYRPVLPYSQPTPPGFHPGPYSRPGPNVAQQLAKASCVAPLIALLLGCLTGSIRGQNGGAGMIIGLVNALLILAGFVMAILALVFMRRHGRDGVIQRAILGLVINTVLVSTIGYFALSMIRVGRKLAAAPRTNSTAVTGGKASRGDPAVLGRQALVNYDGWIGKIVQPGTTLVLTELSDEAPFVQDFRDGFSSTFSVAQVTVQNTGTHGIDLDPDTAVFQYADGHEVKSLRTNDVLGSVKGDPEPWIKRWGTPWTIAQGKSKMDGFIFLPFGTSLHDIVSASIIIEGKRVKFDGRLMKSREKTSLLKQAEQGEMPN